MCEDHEAVIVLGAYTLNALVKALSETEPGFGQYGWLLYAAYIAGVAYYLKHALSQR